MTSRLPPAPSVFTKPVIIMCNKRPNERPFEGMSLVVMTIMPEEERADKAHQRSRPLTRSRVVARSSPFAHPTNTVPLFVNASLKCPSYKGLQKIRRYELKNVARKLGETCSLGAVTISEVDFGCISIGKKTVSVTSLIHCGEM